MSRKMKFKDMKEVANLLEFEYNLSKKYMK